VVGNGGDLGVRVRYSWEQPVVLGSAGGPRQALPIVGADPFAIVNGDTLTNMDVQALADAHARHDALVTLALVPNREFNRYGGVLLDDSQAVTGFVPRGPGANGSYHYIGVQIANAAAFDAVPRGGAARSIGGVYDDLIASRPGSVRGHVSDAEFWDIGTVTDYWRTARAFSVRQGDTESSVGRHARIDASARVTRSILWDNVAIGAGAALDECIVADGVTLPAGSAYRRSIIVASADGDGIAVSPLVV